MMGTLQKKSSDVSTEVEKTNEVIYEAVKLDFQTDLVNRWKKMETHF